MAQENGTGKAVPPYVSYKTLRNYLDSLGQAVPGRIDRSVLNNMSGGTQNQLLAALRALNLIDDRGVPQDALTRLVNSEGAERQRALADVLRNTYPYLFSAAGGFDLATASPKHFGEQFQASGATGETARKCQVFFLAAAQDAGIAVSPHIAKPARQTIDRKPQRRPRQRNSGAIPPRESNTGSGDSGTAPEPAPLGWAQMLLTKFPSFDPQWPDEVKEKWFDGFDRLMAMGESDQTG
jgi:Family of unknown function (DUF5343)